MQWSNLKLQVLGMLARWVAGSLWQTALNAVYLFSDRSDLSGKDKRELAKNLLLDAAKDLGVELRNSAANFLIEAAVQKVLKR